MEEVLMVSQTVFYFVASFAIIALGLIFCTIAYFTVQIGRRLKQISENVRESSAEVKQNIQELFDLLSHVPFIASVFKKGREKRRKFNDEP